MNFWENLRKNTISKSFGKLHSSRCFATLGAPGMGFPSRVASAIASRPLHRSLGLPYSSTPICDNSVTGTRWLHFEMAFRLRRLLAWGIGYNGVGRAQRHGERWGWGCDWVASSAYWVSQIANILPIHFLS